MALYRLGLYDAYGRNGRLLERWTKIEGARAVGGVGAATVTLPLEYPLSAFQRDMRLLVERQAAPRGAWKYVGETCWFLRYKEFSRKEGAIKLLFFDANMLLVTRIVAYAAGTAYADKSGLAGNVINAIVRENLGALALDTARSLATYLTVYPDEGFGATVEKAFARRLVLPVLTEVAATSASKGTYLAFDVVATAPDKLEFRVYQGQRGVDRRSPGGIRPVVLDEDSLTDVVYKWDARDEVTFAYAAGSGEEEDRLVATASDATRMAASPFNRRERLLDLRNVADEDQLEDEAASAVRAGIPKESYEARLAENPATTFGERFDFGDFVTISLPELGLRTDCRLDAFKFTVDQNDDTVDVMFKSDGTSL